jgi:hypothetical protein
MNKLFLLSILILSIVTSCQSKEENFELTFFRWNIHEDYYLKFNSNDTVYFIVDNPIKKQIKFAILNKNEKEKLREYITNFSFPEKEKFSSSVDDGLTYAFVYKTNEKLNRLSIHNNSGSKEFWEFGRFLENIKNNKSFIPTKKIINLDDMNDLVLMPFPPIININSH